jgi:hypothetical protein
VKFQNNDAHHGNGFFGPVREIAVNSVTMSFNWLNWTIEQK